MDMKTLMEKLQPREIVFKGIPGDNTVKYLTKEAIELFKRGEIQLSFYHSEEKPDEVWMVTALKNCLLVWQQVTEIEQGIVSSGINAKWYFRAEQVDGVTKFNCKFRTKELMDTLKLVIFGEMLIESGVLYMIREGSDLTGKITRSTQEVLPMDQNNPEQFKEVQEITLDQLKSADAPFYETVLEAIPWGDSVEISSVLNTPDFELPLGDHPLPDWIRPMVTKTERPAASKTVNRDEVENILARRQEYIPNPYPELELGSSYLSESQLRPLGEEFLPPNISPFEILLPVARETAADIKALEFSSEPMRTCGFWGPPGTMKSSACRQMAAFMGLPYRTVSLGRGMEAKDLTEAIEFKGNTLTVKDAGLTFIARYGGVFVFEEVNAADTGVMHNFFSTLDDTRQIVLSTGETIQLHPQAILCATANIGSEYSGTHSLNPALVRRFQPWTYLDYPDKKTMKEIINLKTQGLNRGIITDHILNLMLDAAEEIRARIENEQIMGGTCGPTEIINWVKMAIIRQDVVAASKSFLNVASGFDKEVETSLYQGSIGTKFVQS
ncbi:MAG: AAA family ATPase [Fastidiosipilaceae bacterium]|jgi:hypothetical protein